MNGLSSRTYGRDVAKAWRVLKKPFTFTVDIAEYNVGKREYFVDIQVYEDEIMQYNEAQRAQIMEYLFTVRDVVYSYGIECGISGVTGSPTRRNIGTETKY
jgi:hypothetical protein